MSVNDNNLIALSDTDIVLRVLAWVTELFDNCYGEPEVKTTSVKRFNIPPKSVLNKEIENCYYL